MAKFKTGEPVIGQNFIYSVELNGIYGVIKRIPASDERFEIVDGSGFCNADYVVSWANGFSGSCDEHNLRKLPPEKPADDQDFIDWFNRVIKKEPLEQIMRKALPPTEVSMPTITVPGNFRVYVPNSFHGAFDE